jgi:hypothetical protein
MGWLAQTHSGSQTAPPSAPSPLRSLLSITSRGFLDILPRPRGTADLDRDLVVVSIHGRSRGRLRVWADAPRGIALRFVRFKDPPSSIRAKPPGELSSPE